MQEHNRARVLAAAREEFGERGFRDAKIDSIAERAGLTRGAVYSNFPGKRALYFAVLAESAPISDSVDPGQTPRAALSAFARAWAARLPLATDERRHGPDRIGMDLLPEILAEEPTRRTFAGLLKLDALLLALALERLAPGPRRVRVAESVLTTLHGMSQLAAAAPGFTDPFDIALACEHLADLGLDDTWAPPHLAWISPARPVDERWSPPAATDAVRGVPARLTGDGVVVVLGLHRLNAAEEAVRAAPPGSEVTAVLVTGDPAELGPLARLAIAEVCDALRQAFPTSTWPRLQVVHDDAAVLAAATGVTAVSNATELAVHVKAGRIVARAEGRGAGHAAARPPRRS